MKFRRGLRERDVPKDTREKRRGGSPKKIVRGKHGRDNDRAHSNGRDERRDEERDASPRRQTRAKNDTRGRDRGRQQGDRRQSPAKVKSRGKSKPQKEKHAVKGRNKPNENEYRRTRSSSPRKLGKAERPKRNLSLPAIRRRPAPVEDKKVRRPRQRDEKRKKNVRTEKHEHYEDFENGVATKQLTELLELNDYETEFQVSPGRAAAATFDEPPKRRSDESTKYTRDDTLQTMSFEDAMADGCVARYDGVITRVFDWASVSSKNSRESSRKQTAGDANPTTGLGISTSNFFGGLFGGGDSVFDSTTESSSVERSASVTQRTPQDRSTSQQTSDEATFTWSAFFAEF